MAAEVIVALGIASKVLTLIASPAFEKAYDRSSSRWRSARGDLNALGETIQTYRAILQDAAERKPRTATMESWMERIADVLLDADDLFDEVATNLLLTQQAGGNKRHLNGVRRTFSFSSKFNPVINNSSIAKEARGIKERLESIEKVVNSFSQLQDHGPNNVKIGRASTTGLNINDCGGIVGRDVELDEIRSFLLDDRNFKGSQSPVIAIVGIGGMGKTALAHLIYNDETVQSEFVNRWWACISDVSEPIEALLRIFQCIKGESYVGQIDMLHYEIHRLVSETVEKNEKYLLVLDDGDGWENVNPFIWNDSVMKCLCSGVKGNRIIVTTRYEKVARAMRATKTYTLKGLDRENSWKLFESIAFMNDEEKHPRKVKFGKEIVEKCANVPLAIKSIAALLSRDPNIKYWERVRDDPNLVCEGDDSIMASLRLSFDQLPSEIKPCFAYCSLFPRNFKIVKEELIYLWIAQGYVKPTESVSMEAVGNGYFNELVRRFFFHEPVKDKHGETIACEMLGLFHQLAKEVAGSQSVLLTTRNGDFEKKPRHLTFGFEMDHLWVIPESWVMADRLRSSLFMYRGSLSATVLDKLPAKFKFLRALDLEGLRIEEVSSSLGDLKLLRYLNLSLNTFTSLPSSVTKLVNLDTLDISNCYQLRALPKDFRKLIKLRVLNAQNCVSLMHMPPRFGELTSLEYLSYFNVGEEPDVITKKAFLGISKLTRKVPKDRDECSQLPRTVRVLEMQNPTKTMPYWDIPSLLPNLVKLHLFESKAIIDCLPPFRCLSSLKYLQLSKLEKLQYIEENEGGISRDMPMPFFPCLESLALEQLPSLEGWSLAAHDQEEHSSITTDPLHQKPQFPSLLNLRIQDCPKLKSMPQGPEHCLYTLEFQGSPSELVQQLQLSYHLCSTCDTNNNSSSNDNDNTPSGSGNTSLNTIDW